jgi:hypothetical protein
MIAIKDVIDFAEHQLAGKGLEGTAIHEVVSEDIDAARKQLARFEGARDYVASNLDVWSDDPTEQFSVAVADVYQKVLNVIDTGNPLTPR